MTVQINTSAARGGGEACLQLARGDDLARNLPTQLIALADATTDEAASDLVDVMRRAAATRDTISDDERGGWHVVHGTGDDASDPASGTR